MNNYPIYQIELTDEQQKILNLVKDWYWNSSEQVFQFAGNPGTGKTTLMKAIVASLNIDPCRIAPMAYVGSAAINMRSSGGLPNAKTIHSTIYENIEEPELDTNGNIVMDEYFNRPKVKYKRRLKKLPDIDLIIIDEAGTVPMRMKNDILSLNKKVLVAGDLDQLPPVADEPAFLSTGPVHVLTQIQRQEANSAIVYLCQRAKQGLPINVGYYGEVLVIEESEFIKIAHKVLPAAEAILCGRNETREKITDIIRYKIFHKQSVLPDMGEKLMCRRNNWNVSVGGINLTNGLVGRVLNQPDVSSFDGTTFTVSFLPEKTDVPFMNVPVDYTYFVADQKERRIMKANNFCKGEAMEYGYCQTVNTAQGSQWNCGIYFEEYLPSDYEARNYTALSRFRKKCIYVKRNRKYC